MRKILYCASTVTHIRNFHLPYLKALHELGYEVWVAANEEAVIPGADRVVVLPFSKSMTSLRNWKAVHLAARLLRKERFDAVSTHTELASAVIRAAVLLLPKKDRPKVFCTVHGYLFNESDGLKKWKYLLPDKICARVTDVLMVMNREDYEIAQKHRLTRGRLFRIDGMGLDLSAFHRAAPEERLAARRELGLSADDYVFLYGAEFSKRKNQALLIRAFSAVCRSCPRMKLLLAGDGALLPQCRALAESLGSRRQIFFLGYRKDMKNLYAASDACVSTSLIEGLPFHLMEAIASGLTVAASDIKGHRELLACGSSGTLFSKGDAEALQRALICAYEGKLAKKAEASLERYDIRKVEPEIMKIYGANE